ncbi:MAG: nuclease-related domain-containing protein [Chloroflexota bacterium]
MKIIDKTPLLNEKGELGIVQRIQGMLQFGYNWPNELQAQKAIITFFDRQLEKGYTLIRNYSLGQSGIMLPIILLGPTGIYVIHITYLRGRYEVRSDTWNVEAGEGYKPAPVNLIQRTMRMATALKAFIERQGVNVPINIEPVLIAGDPGLHIESVRPAIKVMMIDGIKSFVSNLAGGRPLLSNENVFEFTERILNPHPPKKKTALSAGPEPGALSGQQETPQQDVSRARAIFDASEQAKPFDPADFDFAMDDEEPSFEITPPTPSLRESSPALPLPRPKPGSKKAPGMTPGQLAVIAGLVLALLCIAASFAYLVLS